MHFTALRKIGKKNIASLENCEDRKAALDYKVKYIFSSKENFSEIGEDEYDVIATMNLNGDYLSDSAAAAVGGIGISPGANINYSSGHAIFEATHGTAPKYAGLDKVNPSSVILSGVMMLQYMGWTEPATLIERALEMAIHKKRVTYDFERLMSGATLLKCSEFGDEIINNF